MGLELFYERLMTLVLMPRDHTGNDVKINVTGHGKIVPTCNTVQARLKMFSNMAVTKRQHSVTIKSPVLPPLQD
jgi:hypothetical protein